MLVIGGIYYSLFYVFPENAGNHVQQTLAHFYRSSSALVNHRNLSGQASSACVNLTALMHRTHRHCISSSRSVPHELGSNI